MEGRYILAVLIKKVYKFNGFIFEQLLKYLCLFTRIQRKHVSNVYSKAKYN